MTHEKPDWETCKEILEVKFAEAVWISLDIDPWKLEGGNTPRRRIVSAGITIVGGEVVRPRVENVQNVETEFTEAERTEFNRRFLILTRSRRKLGARFESGIYWITLAEFAAFALQCNLTIPNELKALAEADKREAEIRNLKQQVEVLTQERDTWKRTAEDASATTNAARGELTKAQHAKNRERTLAAVLATMATADRKDYTNKTSQKIVVTKLAGLVEDNRTKYEKPGKILSVEEIKNLVGNVLNGDYFP